MLSEIVKVSSIEPRFIKLQPFNNGSCTSCSIKPTCGQYLLNSLYANRQIELPLSMLPKEMDTQSLKKGTQILINIEASKLVSLSMLLYLAPLLSILLMTLLGQFAGFNELVILALDIMVLFLSMRILHQYLKSHAGLEDVNLSLISARH